MMNNDTQVVRAAQQTWVKSRSLKQRCEVARNFARELSANLHALHDALTAPQRSGFRETVSAELMPLADAAKWLSRSAIKILSDRKVTGPGRPLFQRGIRSTVCREPLGVVLVIGTWNYPIFLVGVQILQAIVAGNAVLVKPAKGCERVTRLMVELLIRSGMPEDLCLVLGEEPEYATLAISQGVDLIVLTGSSATGRRVLRQAAETLTPSIMELSGCDAVIVLESANLKRVIDGLLFGLRLNGSATCMAPRRVYIPESMKDSFHESLSARLSEVPDTVVDSVTIERVNSLVSGHHYRILAENGKNNFSPESQDAVAKLLAGRPLVFFDVASDFPLSESDLFAPVLLSSGYRNLEEAISACNLCKYGLTATVFGNETLAKQVASQLSVGTVMVNDLIAPTVDPRLPFGGVRESGFGVTRGVEGLLQMTRPKVIAVNRAEWLPHLDPPQDRDAALLEGILQWCHAGSFRKAFGGLIQAFKAVSNQSKTRSGKKDL
ncbi:MAG: aldehyde dehydrogenase family protein [Planctomycetota bacterium]|nr:aldehyde dehydrogenase family protein [Planctomycetota bacterium]